ncbi:hypothetical protein [Caballeronia sp. LjRoot31]|uniref:hypothetical protein n=1 Tax=Caballeronia sp. LjRoot31 TaxID=3342324 RepID=UPI003ECDA144
MKKVVLSTGQEWIRTFTTWLRTIYPNAAHTFVAYTALDSGIHGEALKERSPLFSIMQHGDVTPHLQQRRYARVLPRFIDDGSKSQLDKTACRNSIAATAMA